MGIGSTNTSNTELQAMLQQTIGKLQSMGFNSAAGGIGSGSDLSGSLWSIVNGAGAAIEGGNEQQAQGYMSILDGIMNIVQFANNHQKKAQEKVNKNAKDIDQADQEAAKKADELKAKIDATASAVGASSENIKKALEVLKDLDGNNSDIQALQQEILLELDIIEDNKKKLNNPDERDEALQEIQKAAGAINTITGQLADLIKVTQETFYAQQEIIAQNVNEVTNQICEATQEISDGAESLNQYITREAAAGTDATAITTDGGVQEATGTTETAAGEAVNSNAVSALFSGGQGFKLIQDGNGRIAAGQTQITGGIKNLGNAVKAIGQIGANMGELQELTNGLGSIGDGVIQAVGGYDQAVQPYIESIGTYNVEAIRAANQALQANVQGIQNGQVTPQAEQENTGGQPQEDPIKQQFRAAFGL